MLSVQPERQTVAQGSSAVIRCFASDDPNARVTWRKVNDNLPSYAVVCRVIDELFATARQFFNCSNFQTSGSELRIPAVEVKDRGVYVCESTNNLGTAQVSASLEVQREDFIYFRRTRYKYLYVLIM